MQKVKVVSWNDDNRLVWCDGKMQEKLSEKDLQEVIDIFTREEWRLITVTVNNSCVGKSSEPAKQVINYEMFFEKEV